MPDAALTSVIEKIRKRDGRIEDFDPAKIERAIWLASRAAGFKNKKKIRKLSQQVVDEMEKRFNQTITPEVEQVQDLVEKKLLENQEKKIHKAFTLYRDLHRKMRDIGSLVDSNELIEKYLEKEDWLVKENANMTYSLQGLNNHVASIISSNFWLHKIYPREIRKAHTHGELHIHDLALISAYCTGWDLKDFLLRGFGGVRGKIHSSPPKHLRTALGQLVNFFYTLQGEVAGAIAVANFDTLMAPFIAYDNLSYEEVKQAMQEFVYNMNVPTRVGFQCVSEDTEILTSEGWKDYQEVKKGDKIKTFNLEKKEIEEQEVESVFKRKYKGKMFNLKNRIQDQLISPKHRVVRKKFNSDKYVLEPIEEVKKLKSPVIIPVSGKNSNKKAEISDEQIKLMAWIIADGTIERPGKHRCCYRVSIYQSELRNKKNYLEIKELLDHFGFEYSEYKHASLGEDVNRLRLNAESSKTIHQWFGTKENIHFIPHKMLKMNTKQSRVFINTYLKADGFEDCKIAVSHPNLLEDLQEMVVNCEYGFTVLERKATVIGNKEIFVLRLIRHKETYIQEIKEVDYEGVIWCPHTKNETIIARRKGKVFITGNTPFTNVTMDLVIPKIFKDEAVIIGGKMQERTYKEFQEEVDQFNRAFAEVMMEGDAHGRVFTFPIPTYSVTKNFEWDNKVLEPIWEMTRKYGIPYFSNFVNSDMDPEDIRSMCCRLQLDNKKLRKRGGLFAANPLTGSVGVVTLNLPRIGYQAETEEDFFEKVEELMELAKDSLQIKREIVEGFTEKGLYPYCRYYLNDIKKRTGEYWHNHFSTIGINGMNEALVNFMGKTIVEPEGKEFALKVMNFMNDKLLDFQKETDQMFNLEATPAEGTSYRFARIDKEYFGNEIICANQKDVDDKRTEPFYTNSTHLPVDYTNDIFEALDNQDELQTSYTGGTVLHGFLGESPDNTKIVKKMVQKIAKNYSLPYFSLTPSFSICPKHGYLKGEHKFCPKCDQEIGYQKEV